MMESLALMPHGSTRLAFCLGMVEVERGKDGESIDDDDEDDGGGGGSDESR